MHVLCDVSLVLTSTEPGVCCLEGVYFISQRLTGSGSVFNFTGDAVLVLQSADLELGIELGAPGYPASDLLSTTPRRLLHTCSLQEAY